MKLIRRILSHMMFIILLAGIVAIYYVRHQIFPESIVEKINQYAAKAHPSLVSFKNERTKPIAVVSEETAMTERRDVVSSVDRVEDAAVTLVDSVEEPVVIEIIEKPEEVKSADITKAETISEESPVVEVMTDKAVTIIAEPVIETVLVEKENKEAEKQVDKKQVEQKELVVAEADKADKTREVKAADSPAVKFVDKPETKEIVVEKPLSSEKEVKATQPVLMAEIESVSSDRQAADYKQILTDARSAYIDSDFNAAIEKYKELIDLEGHEADFYGELGNVYYAMGNWSMAGEYYYEAALRLIEKGNTSQLSYLHRVIQGLDAGRAEKLSQQITKKSR